MRSWMIILTALFCLNVHAEDANVEMNEEELVQAAEAISKSDPTFNTSVGAKTEAEAKTEETAKAAPATDETQIPLYPKSKTVEKAAVNPYWRVVASLIFVSVIGAAAVYVARRRSYKRNIAGTTARIEVLHQHHFGPKKGLALIRVAGEVMLISLTDQNIHMMKAVALIDDEVPGLTNKDFNNFLEDDFTVTTVQDALRSRV